MHIPRVRECRFRSAASAYEATSSDFASRRQLRRRIDIASMRFDIAYIPNDRALDRTNAIVRTDYVSAAERARRCATPAVHSSILRSRAGARVSHFIRAYVRFQSRFYISLSLSLLFLSLEKFHRNFAMKYRHCAA